MEKVRLIRQFGTFDFIIVGAGSAGCVLANRLSANGDRVLLLEAGGRDISPWIHLPIGYGKLFNHPRYNWLYSGVPEPQLDNRRIAHPRGKVLGGSSSINGLVYVRGQKEDFDEWAAAGNPGWSFEGLLPYFRRSECQARGADTWHGSNGPLTVSDQSEPHPLCDAFIAAAKEAGIPANTDFNGASQEGAGYYQLTTRRGRRASTATAYLNPARSRHNLEIVTSALVKRIVVRDGRAIGVVWTTGGIDFEAYANAEVILSAGAINTPQLLQLSGIGPGDLLQSFGIKPVSVLPEVGENLQDHIQVRSVYRARRKITLNDDLASVWRTMGIGLRYLLHRKGPLTVSAGYAGAFMRTALSPSRPDVQLLFITFSTSRMGEALDPFPGFTVSCCPLRPESRGYVRIVSPDAAAAPAIFANFLGTEGDRRTILAGMKEVRRIMSMPAVRNEWTEEMVPGRGCDDDETIMAYVRRTGSTIYHPTCTTRMGSDSGAVVDPELRVRGLEGLRVVDGSVMPSLISGNTNAAIIAIAEKASDLILSSHR